MIYGSVALKQALKNVNASQTDSSIVAAVTGMKIRVLALAAVVGGGGATNITFNSKGSGAGTAITGLFAVGANGALVLPFAEGGWFDTNSGEALTVTTGTGDATGITVRYVLIPA
jgi:hypothetical protein